MPDIFISYRRGDTAGHAGRLYDGLSSRFAGSQVFIDVDAIEPGVDFVERIQSSIGSCDVVVVVIGDDWATMTGEDGRRRIDDPHDFVRLEVASALQRGVAVIPVLVEGARMPGPEDLPPDLQPLARRNALELSDARWQYDFGRLVEAIGRLTDGNGKGRPKAAGARKPVLLGAVAAGVLAIVIGAVVLLAGGTDHPDAPRNVSTGSAAGDRTEVREVLTEWFTDPKPANCDLVTDRWLSNYDGQTRTAQLAACREYLDGKPAGGDAVRIDGLRVGGDSAEALVHIGGLTYQAYLEREGGAWRLDDTDDG